MTIDAVLTGACPFAATGEWAAELTGEELRVLGMNRAGRIEPPQALRPPRRRSTGPAPGAAYAFTRARARSITGRRVIAFDGKTLRGARVGAAKASHLIASLHHGTEEDLHWHLGLPPQARLLLAVFCTPDPATGHIDVEQQVPAVSADRFVSAAEAALDTNPEPGGPLHWLLPEGQSSPRGRWAVIRSRISQREVPARSEVPFEGEIVENVRIISPPAFQQLRQAPTRVHEFWDRPSNRKIWDLALTVRRNVAGPRARRSRLLFWAGLAFVLAFPWSLLIELSSLTDFSMTGTLRIGDDRLSP